MRPVLIFRHIACEGPGYLGEFLGLNQIPFRIIEIDAGTPVPASPAGTSGLVFMGGPMSVNDALPWIQDEIELIRTAHRDGIPVLGHCLGGQLISKALGGQVTRNPVPEIGWYPLQCAALTTTTSWLGKLDFTTECFHWHGEVFSLPEGAHPLFHSRFCHNQGFMLDHSLALQCHVEMQSIMVQEWLDYYKDDLPLPGQSVQSPSAMMAVIDQRISHLHRFADIVYGEWIKALARAD